VNELPAALFVYGVTASSAGPIPTAAGVDSAPVGTVQHAGLSALVSPIRRTELRAADVRAHWRVLEDAFAHATVLPVRFGTVMESEDEVRDRLLEPDKERLVELLAAMDGLIQLNVRGRYDEDTLLRAVLRESRPLARLRDRAERSGTLADQVALGQQVEQEIERRRAMDATMVRQALDPLAVAARDESVRHPDAFNIAFLVARDGTDGFGAGVSQLRDKIGERIELSYVGPTPPFSFADAELGAEAGAWA
jgi:hypothetical protein